MQRRLWGSWFRIIVLISVLDCFVFDSYFPNVNRLFTVRGESGVRVVAK